MTRKVNHPAFRLVANFLALWTFSYPLIYTPLSYGQSVEQATEPPTEVNQEYINQLLQSVPEMDPDQAEWFRREGGRTGARALYGSRTSQVNTQDDPMGDDPRAANTLYLRELFPQYGTETQQEVEQKLREVPANASNLGVYSDQYLEQLAQGNNYGARAYQLIRTAIERPDATFNPMDPIFAIPRAAFDGSSPFFDAYYGECTTTELFVNGPPTITHIPEVQTCNQVWDGDGEACTAQRQIEVQPVATKVVLTINAVSGPLDCDAEAQTALESCTLASCDTSSGLTGALCQSLQCAGLTGDDLAQCQASCDADQQTVLANCQAAPPTEQCGFFFEPTYNQCVADNCGANPSATCLSICENAATGATNSCNSECDLAADDALQACLAQNTTLPPVPTTFSGTFAVGSETVGVDRSFEQALPEFTLIHQVTPFNVDHQSASGEPYYFTANHQISIDGGSATVSSWGSRQDAYTTAATLQASGASQIEVTATLYQVVQNTLSGCSDFMDTVADGFCEGTLQCTDLRSSIDFGAGLVVDGNGPGAALVDVLRPWHSTLVDWGSVPELADRMCFAVQSTPLTCDFFLGYAGSYVDINGNVVHVSGDDTLLEQRIGPPPYVDDCGVLIEDPQCTGPENFECVQGGEGPVTGRCYVRDVQFDCGEFIEVPQLGYRRIDTECGTPIQCVSGDCAKVAPESSRSFNKAAVAMSSLNFSDMDTGCLEDDPDTGYTVPNAEDCTPIIFRGEATQCKIPIGSGWLSPNCCRDAMEAAAGVEWVNYMKLLHGTYMVATHPVAIGTLSNVPVVGSAINGAQSTVGYVGGAFRSAFESMANSFGFNVTSTASSAAAVETAAFTGMQQFMAQGVYDFLANIGMDQLANSLFAVGADGAVIGFAELGQTIQQVVQFVGWVFMVYQVLVIIANIIWACEEPELQLGVKKKIKACHYVGKYCSDDSFFGCVVQQESYCCYKSPLSRIMQEQIHIELGIDWGTPQEPNCEGLTPHQLARVPWDRLDLSEWEAMLTEANMIPTADLQQLADYAADAITPKRAIAGEPGVTPAGPDGLVSAASRNQDLVAANAQHIDDRNRQLPDEPVTRHEDDLMPWWTATTDQHPDDEIPVADDALPPGLGDLEGCEDRPAPYGWFRQTGWRDGFDYTHLWPYPPLNSNGVHHYQVEDVVLGANRYAALEFTTTDEFERWAIIDGYDGSEERTVAISVSQCPGDFNPGLPPGCLKARYFASILFATDREGWCPLEPNQTYYLNVAFGNPGPAGLSSTCEREDCVIQKIEEWWYP